jgi:hypothetical protein
MLLLNNMIILLVQNYEIKLVLLSSSLLLTLSLFLSIPNIKNNFPEVWPYHVTQNYHNQRRYYYYYEYQYYH